MTLTFQFHLPLHSLKSKLKSATAEWSSSKARHTSLFFEWSVNGAMLTAINLAQITLAWADIMSAIFEVVA